MDDLTWICCFCKPQWRVVYLVSALLDLLVHHLGNCETTKLSNFSYLAHMRKFRECVNFFPPSKSAIWDRILFISMKLDLEDPKQGPRKFPEFFFSW